MASISFLMLAEPGHLNPSFKLAKALKRLGHQVRYLGPAHAAHYIALQGFECVPLPGSFFPNLSRMARYDESLPPEAHVPDAEDFFFLKNGQVQAIASRLNNRQEFVAHVERSLKELGERLKGLKLDLLIADPYLALIALIASQAGVPTIFLSTSLLLPFDDEDDAKNPLVRAKLPTLFLCPKEFGSSRAQQQGIQSLYIEPSIDLLRMEAEFHWRRLSEVKPLIYCSIGSQGYRYSAAGRFIQTVIAAFATRPKWQLVLAAGGGFRRDEFRSIPSNVLLLDHAPQLKLLQKSAAAITHGGLGTVKECIIFDVPMVVFPFDNDQHINAERVAHHGMGCSGDSSTVSVTQFQALLQKVLEEPSFKTNVTAMRERFQEIECSGVGARAVENFLQERGLH